MDNSYAPTELAAAAPGQLMLSGVSWRVSNINTERINEAHSRDTRELNTRSKTFPTEKDVLL